MKLKMADFKVPPKSFGDYLCLADAADVIGNRVIKGWKKSDVAKLKQGPESSVANGRLDEVHNWLVALLSGGMVRAFGQNNDGGFFPLERERLSAPFFNIDIHRSAFLWTPEDWDVIFINRPDIQSRMGALRDSKPRDSVLYDWREISCLAWKLALDNVNLRKASRLMAAVKLQYSLETDKAPDDRDLRDLVNDIINHLGDRVLSRGVSDALTSREGPSQSV